ncbi:EAL domain-containing response regulator [Aestuariibacter salexigens]|uniref:EAL domain-containing response regulator n=1 Tax=Aestuariibacter salexigens TaxID=226010 RepID=UPI00041F5098|nr:EAL domain-containing response regulator [Aestuariibacter salexigens]
MANDEVTNSFSIVIIEDDKDIIDVLCHYAAASGANAHAFSEVEHIDHGVLANADLIFLDLMLQSHDGLDVVKIMQDHQITTPIIICSGMDAGIISSAQDLLQDYGLSFAGKLLKPFTYAQFEEVLTRKQQSDNVPITGTEAQSIQLSRVDVQQALNAGWLTLAYQPKLNPSNDMICGVECLVRMEHPLFGTCMPGQFLQKAIAAGLMTKLTQTVIQKGLEELCHSSIPEHVTIAFNIDPGSLSHDFLAWVIATAEDYDVSPKRICLEITEVSALELTKDIKTILTKLRIRGFSISLDDFGTGYSTIQELNDLPFNELKVDRLFVSSMLEKDTSFAIVRSTIELAKRLDYTVVAEGVETQQQLEKLIELGCGQVQGFLFCKPVSIELLEGFYQQSLDNQGRDNISE